MRILFVHRNARIGGANTYLQAVLPELRRRGHQVHLMMGPGPLLPLLGELLDAPPTVALPLEKVGIRTLRALVEELKPDVINTHTVTAGRIALVSCQDLGVPIVQHVHSLAPLDEAGPVLEGAARVIVMNRSVARWVAQVPGADAKTFLSRLPVDQTRFRPAEVQPHTGFKILYCARLSKRKAAYATGIICAMHELQKSIPGATLTIVGGGSQKLPVACCGMRSNLSRRRRWVRMLGETLDTSGLVADADLVVGAGYVVLEALASARHAVGVGIQGMTGYVTEGNLAASIEANFGDHDAAIRSVTPAAIGAEILAAHEAWRAQPRLEWGPGVIAEEFSVSRVCDDLEQAFGV